MATAAPATFLPRPTSSWPALELRVVARPSATEVFLTGVAAPGSAGAEAARLYGEVADALATLGVQPLHEKLYGRMAAREPALAARAAALRGAGLDPGLPCTFLQGAPVHAGELAGVQVWGVIPKGGAAAVTSAGGPGPGRGRCWTGPGYRLLHLSGLAGAGPTVTAQAEGMWIAAVAALERHGLSLTDVPRTWITMARILDWYGEFNRVRTCLFERHGVGADPARSFPASTGIQGRAGDEECLLELLAVGGPAARITPIHATSRQQRAFDYGSAFSRGAAVAFEGRETVFVSGTASLDAAGRTLHVGQPEQQVLETLLGVAAVLEARGAGLEDLCQATVFCKTPAVYRAYQHVSRLLSIPPLPAVPVLADVCRPELLVEVEAIGAPPAEGAP